MHDVFQPRHEPARSIYDAFQNEATKRKGRSVEEWVKAERDAVFREAAHQAQKLGLVGTDDGRCCSSGTLREGIGGLRREVGIRHRGYNAEEF